ncbi:MAG TPA: carboxylating nicotinate-nucleotide diphosphorylase [Candidatus Acidoferrales bacterium]|nr:carboxylating nicotinate-nucleotide diphosphorylase [Candidatus Acidoferrales bacterium]
MIFKDILKERIHHDLGFDFFVKDGAPHSRFNVIFKENGIVCGMIFVPTIVKLVDEEFFLEPVDPQSKPQVKIMKKDGDRIKAGDIGAEIAGNAEVLLKAERTICNVLSELSGIATHVNCIIDAHYANGRINRNVFLLDTRKGDPLMRPGHKYAVRVGGAKNHRAGFFDGILVKDNDISVYGGVREAIDRRIREEKLLTRVEIEVGNLKDLQTVLNDGRVDAVLLDNMPVDTLKKAVDMIGNSGKQYLIEASGVREEEIGKVSETGVNFISLSSLVRRAPYLDVSMKTV